MSQKKLNRVISSCLRFSRTVISVAFITVVAGCGYPEVSEQTYELSKALYSACNRRDAEHLEKVDAMIEQSVEEGKLTQREAGWLNEIISDAEAGNWEAATIESRRIMEDQVKN